MFLVGGLKAGQLFPKVCSPIQIFVEEKRIKSESDFQRYGLRCSPSQ